VYVVKVCYVLDALLSPYVLLSASVTDTSPTDSDTDNVTRSSGRCVVMAVFLHYFFLAQCSAIVVQVTALYDASIVIFV